MGKRTGNPRGRPPGSKNKITAKREEAMREAAAKIEAVLEAPFEGDAHALLVAVYKDTKLDLDLRVDAAKAAIRFEKPALATTEFKGDMTVRGGVDAPRRPETPEEWNARRQRELEAMGAAAGSTARGH